MPSDVRLLVGYTMVAVVVYTLLWPTHVLIADEVAYLDDALRLLSRAPACVPAEWSGYPPGVALVAAALIGLSGHPQAAFGLGLLSWLLGLGALGLLLQRWRRPLVWAFYPALFVPGLVLTRTLMSDVPSFGLAAVFLCAYAGYGHRRWGAFSAGLCAGTGLLFRETNLLWAAPFLVGAFQRSTRRATWLWAGFLPALTGRLLWAEANFGHFAYVRDPGVDFSLAYLPQNLAFYALTLTVLCPAGLFFLKNNLPFRQEIALAVLAMLLLYGTYGYDAFAKSGSLKGLVLQGRFMLPLIPLLAFAGAFSERLNASSWFRKGTVGLAVLLFAAVHLGGWAYNRQQQRLTEALLCLPADAHWSLTYDESRKYLNALHTTACPLPLSKDNLPLSECYVHLFSRDDSADWHKKNAMAAAALEQLAKQRPLNLVSDQRIRDGTRLRIWRAKKKP